MALEPISAKYQSVLEVAKTPSIKNEIFRKSEAYKIQEVHDIRGKYSVLQCFLTGNYQILKISLFGGIEYDRLPLILGEN